MTETRQNAFSQQKRSNHSRDQNKE